MSVVERHDVSVLGTKVECSCRKWSVTAKAWGVSLARRLAFAHVSAPERSTEDVLAFVEGS